MSQTTNATESAILRATRKLLQESSFDDLSVARILEAADVSRATFYFYFASKDDAFVALLGDAAGDIVAEFERLIVADPTREPEALAAAITGWLRLEEAPRAIIRNAIHEWPRRPEIRRLYLTGVSQMASVLERVIEEDREKGLAPPGVAASELAAVLLWTIERTLAGSLAGEAHLEDTEQVTKLLGDLFVSTIYGTPAA